MTAAPPYPRAERLDIVDELHGRTVADPYRWLEDPDDPRTRAWSAAQDQIARGHLDALPGRDRFAAALDELMAAGWVGVPSRWRQTRRWKACSPAGTSSGATIRT